MASIIGLVAAGLGLSLVPASLTELRRSGVVYRKLTSKATLELAMAWRRETDHPIVTPSSTLFVQCRGAKGSWTSPGTTTHRPPNNDLRAAPRGPKAVISLSLDLE